MGHADYLALGDWNAYCSMCNRKFKASELTKNWQGMYRCARCQEPRQPQDFVRGQADIQTPPWTQNPPDDDIYIPICDMGSRSTVPGLMGPGCAIPGRPYHT